MVLISLLLPVLKPAMENAEDSAQLSISTYLGKLFLRYLQTETETNPMTPKTNAADKANLYYNSADSAPK